MHRSTDVYSALCSHSTSAFASLAAYISPGQLGLLTVTKGCFAASVLLPAAASAADARLTNVMLLTTPVVTACMQVFCIQFYLGTTRLQLEHKGDGVLHHYTNFANIIVSFGFVVIPVIGWLLDHKGYGITLGTINCIGVICSVLQAIPSLRLQVSAESLSIMQVVLLVLKLVAWQVVLLPSSLCLAWRLCMLPCWLAALCQNKDVMNPAWSCCIESPIKTQ